jgi:hypothetical protein
MINRKKFHQSAILTLGGALESPGPLGLSVRDVRFSKSISMDCNPEIWFLQICPLVILHNDILRASQGPFNFIC